MVVDTLTGDKTVSVMAIAHKTWLGLICAVAITAALTGSAAAQFNPSINLEQEKHRTPEQIAHDKAVDQAYQSAAKKIPDQNAANDPWADVSTGATGCAGKEEATGLAEQEAQRLNGQFIREAGFHFCG